ncbi:MAG: DUF4055 domain-containing protein [Paracoccaceae bacterium]
MSDNVAKRSKAVAVMVQAGAKGRALMGGTTAMREAGEAYLPRFKSEDRQDYDARLNSSWLFNGFKKACKDMVGRAFEKPVEIQVGPNALIDWSENIDMQGRDLSVFASEVFKDGFATGVSFIMVDAPRRDGETTRQMAEANGLRPYLVHLKAEEVLGWKTATYGNALGLSQFRIMEEIEEPDDKDEFATKVVKQVRVLDRMEGGVSVRLFRQGSDKKWALHDEYRTDAPEITVAPYYAQRTGFFTGEPPLEDLADVNIAHWQSQSDQRNILHFARVPILHVSGRDNDEPLKISAGTAVASRDVQAKLEWVEHKGEAIDAGRQDLKDLEFQMEILGLQLLVERASTATGAALDAAKETSGLAMMADNLKDALEQALSWMCEYGGLGEQSITLAVNKDYGVSVMTAQEVTAMLSMVNTGQLSRQTFLEELKRRGVVRADLDTQEELDRIETEGPDLGGNDVSE